MLCSLICTPYVILMVFMLLMAILDWLAVWTFNHFSRALSIQSGLIETTDTKQKVIY